MNQPIPVTTYGTAKVNGVNMFYRQAGSPDNPAIVLLHGFPTSSHMYRELIPRLASDYFVIAPDFPGYGYTESPSPDTFTYTFDNLAKTTLELINHLGLKRFAIYVQDYGAPVGFRLFMADPTRITAIVTQNGNAYDAGFGAFWDEYVYPLWRDRNSAEAIAKTRQLLTLDITKYQYSFGARDFDHNVNPDAWAHAQSILDRPGNDRIQLDLFYDYGSNPPLYPSWHEAFRKHQPPLLAVWGKNDPIFIYPGAEAYRADLPDAEIHLLNTGHFALEEDVQTIAAHILDFLKRKITK